MRAASSSAAPSPSWWAGARQLGPVEAEVGEQPAAIGVGKRERRVPFEPEQVEDHVRHRHLGHLAPDGGVRCQVHPTLEEPEARPPVGIEGDDLAVDDHPARALVLRERAQLRVARGEVRPVAPDQAQPAGVDVPDGSHAVPLELVAVGVVGARQAAAGREHRGDLVGHRLARRVRGRVHPVDHPVLATRLEQRVAPGHPLAVEDRDHLVGAELLRLVGAGVPDLHPAGAVVAGRDLAVELEVFERVVLGPDGEPVLVRVRRDPARQCPGREGPVVLEPQVPVQPAGVVLLDHEPRPGARRGALAAARLRGFVEVALGAVAVEAVGHACILPRPGEPRT